VYGAAPFGLTTLCGRAAQFEQETPFGVVVDALDDYLEGEAASLPDRIGAAPTRLLATVFPSLSAAAPGEPEADLTGLARYRLFRAVRQLLDQLAEPSGLMLVLDDVHWADVTSVELLDHLVRHPPRGRVLIAVAYRPAQASPQLSALVEAHGSRLAVDPLTEDEVAQFLGPRVSKARSRELYEASRGNPFYLEALARMAHGWRRYDAPGIGGGEEGGLPRTVRAALEVELSGLSSTALLVAQAAAVTSDEFQPVLAAVAADVPEDAALDALDELVSRDVVRPAPAGRFRFRHPLVRNAAYSSAAAGWRLAAHARIADHLAGLGAPATVRAHHVERSGRFGDQNAVATLVEAARAVAPQAPSTAAHWLSAALRLMPTEHETRLALLLELATAQAFSGQITEGRDTAREALRLLPPHDHTRRARAARICAMMERHLDRPHQGRTLLLDELRRIPDPRSAVALPLRLRLVADSLMRSDYRAAQAVLDLMPDDDPGWEPSLPLAIAAMRPLPALAAGRVSDAIRFVDRADQLLSAASDDHVAESLDTVAWLCWTELHMGRHKAAVRHLERAIAVARAAGQSYIVPNLLAGQANALATLGHLNEAALVAEEAAEVARLLASGQHLVFALVQQSLVASWSGDDAAALRFADEALDTGAGHGEWWSSMARYVRSRALISAGRRDEGAADMLAAFDGRAGAPLDPATKLYGCEVMAHLEAQRGRRRAAARWGERASRLAHPGLPTSVAFARLARARAQSGAGSADARLAAQAAEEAAEIFAAAGLRLDAARAQFQAGTALAEAGERGQARERLGVAAELFAACGAETLNAQSVRELRRLGVRVPAPTAGGRRAGPHGLSPRELEVAELVVEGCTNQQVAEKLVVSIRTVETHLSNIFRKLGVSSRVGVVTALQRSGD
jgi:ATP/maltotriose-dependent transcriptional regulator MalT